MTMARNPSTAFLLACFLVLSYATRSAAEADSQTAALTELKQQIENLGQQIKEAEAGKADAEKLLEAGKATQQKFAKELESLQAAVADKDTQGSSLQKQIKLLKEEAKKLRSEEELHQDLRAKFELVSGELEATKMTLANTLQQLADRSSSASAAQSKVVDAERELEEAIKSRDNARQRVSELEGTAEGVSKLQKEVEVEKAKSAKLQVELVTLSTESATSQAEIADLKKELKAAAKDGAAWRSKAEKAERAVEGAEKRLEKAMQEHSSTQAALLQAEAKAEEAVRKLEQILTSWLPHWLEQRYQQILEAVQPTVQRVQPALDKAWKQGKALSQEGRTTALWAYGITKARTVTAWQKAQPTLNKAFSDSQKHLSTLSEHMGKASQPHLKGISTRLQQGYVASQAYASEALSHPQVLKVRRQVEITIKQLENLAIKYLKKVPALRQYATRPYVTYLVYMALLAPIVTLLVPVLTLTKAKKPEKQATEHDTRRLSQRDDFGPEQTPKGGSKSKKSRRISVGEESVRVP